jgi:hypothetical protein
LDLKGTRKISRVGPSMPLRLATPSWDRDDFCDVHCFDSTAKLQAIRCVAVAQQIPGRGVPRKGFDRLAREPSCGRTLGDGGAHDSPSIVGQNDRHVEQPERCGRHNEHVDRSDALGVIPQEVAPVLRRCSSPSQHVLHATVAWLTSMPSLSGSPWILGVTPERVGAAHLPNQIANLAFH